MLNYLILLYNYPINVENYNYIIKSINQDIYIGLKKKIDNLVDSHDIEKFIQIINEKKEKIFIFNVFNHSNLPFGPSGLNVNFSNSIRITSFIFLIKSCCVQHNCVSHVFLYLSPICFNKYFL